MTGYGKTKYTGNAATWSEVTEAKEAAHPQMSRTTYVWLIGTDGKPFCALMPSEIIAIEAEEPL